MNNTQPIEKIYYLSGKLSVIKDNVVGWLIKFDERGKLHFIKNKKELHDSVTIYRNGLVVVVMQQLKIKYVYRVTADNEYEFVQLSSIDGYICNGERIMSLETILTPNSTIRNFFLGEKDLTDCVKSSVSDVNNITDSERLDCSLKYGIKFVNKQLYGLISGGIH